MECRKKGERVGWMQSVEWMQHFNSSWGTRVWLTEWLEHSWAAPSKHKNKQGSHSTAADCLGIYFLDCSIRMMAPLSWPLLLVLAWGPLAAELYLITQGDQDLQGECWPPTGVRRHTQILVTPRTWPPSFSLPLFLLQGAITFLGGIHPKWTDFSLFWDNGGWNTTL